MGADTYQTEPELPAEDAELVDLLTAVLVDPNVHTDLRMRLHQEISALLRAVHRELYGDPDGDLSAAAAERLSELLSTVLVDPNLYSDLRLRLHRQIRTIVYATRNHLPPPGGAIGADGSV